MIANRDAAEPKIQDALGDDEALALAVRHCGGWAKLVASFGDSDPPPRKAQTAFLQAFGRACGELRGPRARAPAALATQPATGAR